MDKFPIYDKTKYEYLVEKAKKIDESNAMFGQTALGNNILRNAGASQYASSAQLLYVTTGSSTTAGRTVDMSMLSRNSTVMACIGAKARAIAQLPIKVMAYQEDGSLTDAAYGKNVSARDKAKARQVLSLLQNPNNFQSQYEFWYQWCMWYELAGETFTLLWRKDKKDALQTPLEMYVLDSTLITATITETRYPAYRLSTPSYGYNKDDALAAHEVIHLMEQAWQGSAGFNKGILAAELVALDQDIDLYANFIMQNGAKPTGMFTTTQVIPDNKFKELAARLKETWSSMTGSRTTDPSKPGQSMLLDNGMTYTPLEILNLQDADAAALKIQTMKRICGLFGVPAAMIGVGESSYNNTQAMLDEFYKSVMYPCLVNIQQKLKSNLLKGYPNLCIEFQTENFLKGAPLDQMNYVVAGVNAGIMTPNEAREYLGSAKIEGADKLKDTAKPAEPIAGTSPQDTGGGGNTNRVGKTGQAGKA